MAIKILRQVWDEHYQIHDENGNHITIPGEDLLGLATKLMVKSGEHSIRVIDRALGRETD